jgi:hypothetical protein
MTPRTELTRRELQLLEAVRQVLDLPAPDSYDDMLICREKQRDRAYQVIGCLTDIKGFSATSILRVLGKWAAEPLGYTPADSSANEVVDLSHG